MYGGCQEWCSASHGKCMCHFLKCALSVHRYEVDYVSRTRLARIFALSAGDVAMKMFQIGRHKVHLMCLLRSVVPLFQMFQIERHRVSNCPKCE